MGTYAGVDYNLTECRLQSRLQHMYHDQLYARVDLNPILCQSQLYTTIFGLSVCYYAAYPSDCTRTVLLLASCSLQASCTALYTVQLPDLRMHSV
jgi:hypothetical protein